MTDICVKIYRYHLLYAREYWFAVAVVVVAVILETYLHKWCLVIIGVGNGLASVRRQATTWNNTAVQRPKDILLLNKTKQTFHQVQFIWKQTRIQILHRVWANHYLNQWWLDVSWSSMWASVMESRLCDEIEAFKRTLKTHPFVKFVNESTLAIWLEASL